MHLSDFNALRIPLLALVLSGCESDTAELIQKVNAAREGCTEEMLKSASEECVQMMERYAGMGTEVIETYIGAVKSLDQALQRMPPAQFDTSGLGHALSPQNTVGSWGDPTATSQGLSPDGPSFSRQSGGRPSTGGWSMPAYPGKEQYRPSPRYGAPYGDEYYDPDYDGREYGDGGEHRYDDPRYGRPDPYDRVAPGAYPRGGGYDPRDPRQPGYDPRYGGREDPYHPSRPGTWRDERQDPRYPPGRPGYPDERYEEEERWRRAAPVRPRVDPPARGQLLPPEERLRRPWLQDQREWTRDRRVRPGTEWTDTLPDGRGAGRRPPR